MNQEDIKAINFDLPKNRSNVIKVIGVGGGGSNAINYMFQQGIKGVDFIVCNTDAQALDVSNVPLKVQLGSTLTSGQGAGSIPEVGKNAAIENLGYLQSGNFENAWTLSMVKVRYIPLVMHLGFGVIMGWLLSLNLFEERSPFKRRVMLILALAVPVIFHGSYNYMDNQKDT